MTRHSKNNNALAVFTYQEKLKLKNVYGTLETRVGRDSMKPVDSCSLCIAKARNPVCCEEGHVYCKECILDSILKQKKALKEEKEKVEKHNMTVITPEQKAEMEERERNMNKFLEGNAVISNAVEVGPSTKACAFWQPDQTPSAEPAKLKEKVTGTLCYASKEPHPIRFECSLNPSLKKLLAVMFKENEDVNCCPVCLKAFSLGTSVKVIKSCGHAVCTQCITKTVSRNNPVCPVCSTKMKLSLCIQLNAEGTGFSAKGKALTTKETLPFQC